MRQVKLRQKLEYEEDGPYYEVEDFLAHDLDLMVLCLLLQAHKQKREVFHFVDFYKGAYWSRSDYPDDAQFNDELYGIEDSIFDHICFMVSDLRVANVIAAGIDDADRLTEDVVRKIADYGPIRDEDQLAEYQYTLEQVFFLKNIIQEDRLRLLAEYHDNNKDVPSYLYGTRYENDFFSNEEGFFAKLQLPILEAPQRIIMKFLFDENGLSTIEQKIQNYIDGFAADAHLTGERGEKKFSQHIESFYRYIHQVNFVGRIVNIPFSVLQVKDFDAVKVLKYLEYSGRISINWLDEGSWSVHFLQVPTSPSDLVGEFEVVDIPESKTQRLKYNLSFAPMTSVLSFTDQEGSMKDIKIIGQVQKEVLRIIFEKPEKAFDEWSVYDICEKDIGGDLDEKAVANALFQLNRKIALKMPAVKKLFVYSKHSAQLNPEYINKN